MNYVQIKDMVNVRAVFESETEFQEFIEILISNTGDFLASASSSRHNIYWVGFVKKNSLLLSEISLRYSVTIRDSADDNDDV